MSPEPTPLESLLERLRAALGELSTDPVSATDPVSGRVQSVVEGFLEQFELVPRREYDAHLATLERLARTVAELEARIDRLERPSTG